MFDEYVSLKGKIVFNKMSFRVKASHKLVNQSPQPETKTESYLEYSLSDILSADDKDEETPSEPKTRKETTVVSGSGSGMAVRTSVTAMPDYY